MWIAGALACVSDFRPKCDFGTLISGRLKTQANRLNGVPDKPDFGLLGRIKPWRMPSEVLAVPRFWLVASYQLLAASSPTPLSVFLFLRILHYRTNSNDYFAILLCYFQPAMFIQRVSITLIR